MNHVYVAGDQHGIFGQLLWQIQRGRLFEDAIILLGDAGVNYFGDYRDVNSKNKLQNTGCTFLLVRGNHEARPGGEKYSIKEIEKENFKGRFMEEEGYPNILYMLDGETYTFRSHPGAPEKTALCIGGAYSVDKYIRLHKQEMGYPDFLWFPDEQLSKEEMDAILPKVQGGKWDYVFTHTCPTCMIPQDRMLSWVDRSTVDRSMEEFLQKVHDNINFSKWYCGHWHVDRTDGFFRFLYHDLIELGETGYETKD